MNLIITAAKFAHRAHADQKRKYNGRPFIEHPARVAGRMSYHELSSPAAVAAAWLHDVVEDTEYELVDIAQGFGDDVVQIVDDLTNPSKGSKALRAERKQMDRDHIAQVSHVAKVIKLIDRIDNLNNMLVDRDFIDDKFLRLYTVESVQLLSVLDGADETLEEELGQSIENINDYLRKESQDVGTSSGCE